MDQEKARHLWKPVQTADRMAEELTEAARALPDEYTDMKEKASAAANRLDRQQDQMLGLMNYLIDNFPEEQALEIFVKAGIDRNELVSVWGIDPQQALDAQGW